MCACSPESLRESQRDTGRPREVQRAYSTSVCGEAQSGRAWIEQGCHALGWLAGGLAGWLTPRGLRRALGLQLLGMCFVVLSSGSFEPRGKLGIQLSVMYVWPCILLRGPGKPRETREAHRGPKRPREAQRSPKSHRGTETHREAQRGRERPMYICMHVCRQTQRGRAWTEQACHALGSLAGGLAGWLGQESLEGHRGSSCPELSGFFVCQFQASKDNGAPAVGYCVVLCVSQLGAPGPPWGCNCLSDKPREAQRGQERLREAQRGPKKPREPQIGTETHREAQRGPERPKEAYVV